MNSLILKGDYQNIGQQLGKIYRRNGKTFNDKIDRIFYQKQMSVYKKFYPEMLVELKGIAAGGHYDFDQVIYDNICGEINWYRNQIQRTSCTIFGVQNKFGTFVGRNYDWYPVAIATIYKYYNSQAYKYVAITDNGCGPQPQKKDLFYYIDDAINEQGLYIGITFAFGAQIATGLSSAHMRKLIIERCKNVSEALALFKKIPVGCPKNFFLADRSGEMVVVEHASGKNYKVIKPAQGILIKTNHYLDPILVKQDLILSQRPSNSTFVRYFELFRNINLLDPKKIKLSQVEKLILAKNSYIRQNSFTSKTIWSLVLDMKKRKYYFYYRGRKTGIKV